MADGYTVTPDVVDGHAAVVAGHADRVTAAATASTHYPGTDDFGLIGMLFASAVQDAAQRCTADIATLAAAARRDADGLAACAASYRATEQKTAGTFDGLHR